MGIYKLADLIIEINNKYIYTTNLLKKYQYIGPEKIDFSVTVTDEVINRTKQVEDQKDHTSYPIGYIESLEIYRVISNEILNYDGILFHASCVVVNEEAFLFTALSGTGKSTHTRLWLENIPGSFIINDDKPLLRYIDNKLYVYGTPWSGKDFIDKNTKCQVKAICQLTRSQENYIKPLEKNRILSMFMNQTIWFEDEIKMDKLLSMIDQISKDVEIDIMGCNISKEAALMAYNYMRSK